MIGIIGAMQVEVEGLCAAMVDTRTEEVSGIRFFLGKLWGQDAVVARCGVGKVFAALCAQTMILRYAPTLLINTGVAGTLTPALGIGDVAIATRLAQHDMDTTPLGDPRGWISGLDTVYLPADVQCAERLAAAAREVGLTVVEGTIVSGDQFIASGEAKAGIAAHFDGIACEMEGAAIAQVCAVNRLPCCVLRAISDGADGSAPENFPAFVALAAERTLQVLKCFLTA